MMAYALLKGARTGVLDAKYAPGRRPRLRGRREGVRGRGQGRHGGHPSRLRGRGPRRRPGVAGALPRRHVRVLRQREDPQQRPQGGRALHPGQPGEGETRVSWQRILEQPLAWYGTARGRGDRGRRRALPAIQRRLAQERGHGARPGRGGARPRVGRADTGRLHHRQRRDLHADAVPGACASRRRAHSASATSFERGLDFLLAAQYPNGGWPQFFPLRDDYSRHVTFNDGAMVGVLRLLREVGAGTPPFGFVDPPRRLARARAGGRARARGRPGRPGARRRERSPPGARSTTRSRSSLARPARTSRCRSRARRASGSSST